MARPWLMDATATRSVYDPNPADNAASGGLEII